MLETVVGHRARSWRSAAPWLAAGLLALAGCVGPSGPELAAEAAALLPDAFPLYPGARVERVDRRELPVASAAADAPALVSVSVSLATDEPPDQVLLAYTALLQSSGWKPRVRDSQGDHALIARRGRNTALVFVRGDADGSRIDVLVVPREKRRRARPRQPAPDV